MGCWGNGPFECDDILDFVDGDLPKDKNGDKVRAIFDQFWASGSSDAGLNAFGAAEIVYASVTNDVSRLPEGNARMFATKSYGKFFCEEDIAKAAMAVAGMMAQPNRVQWRDEATCKGFERNLRDLWKRLRWILPGSEFEPMKPVVVKKGGRTFKKLARK